MNKTLEAKLRDLPAGPGVYQFKNAAGSTLYVGKAKSLRNRVRSYFTGEHPSPRVALMVRQVVDVDVVVTDNEIEALALENNLIKANKPKYNVNLKDDKSYPFVKVTDEPYPRIFPTRVVRRDGGKYFGPYTDVRSMRAALRTITKLFRTRSCKLAIDAESIEKKKHKVCLDYHIDKCDGPCEGLISREDYNRLVGQAVRMLRGRTDDLIAELNEEMNAAAETTDFERAAKLRDTISQLESVSERQKVVVDQRVDRDVLAIAREDRDAVCAVFCVRAGKLVAKKDFRFKARGDEEPAEIYAAFVKQFYDGTEIPHEIYAEAEPDDAETIAEWLSERAGHAVRLHTPQRGDQARLARMCKQNAILQLKELQLQKMKKDDYAPYTLSALQRDLRLKRLPRSIECFDVSTLQGTDTVAGLVVFENGKPKKSRYRKFIIRDTVGQDDFASMNEAVKRRYKRAIEEEEPLPDLIMVDGGKGQLSAAVKALSKVGINDVPIVGLAKRLEEVFIPGASEPTLLPRTSSSLKLLQQLRDEAHRFAITFHRKRREKRTFAAELTEIKGVGNKTADRLVKEMGSVRAVKDANVEALAGVVGEKRARAIKEHFQGS